ncbi:MAG: site-specific DNA-methyltransferase [Phycisphaeraceae bacterium]|nr:site-specific DNA-methyltransferase [Phycisphaeraceae bacterium]
MLDDGQRTIGSVACSLYNNDVAKKPKPATNQDPVMLSQSHGSILHGRSLSNRIVNDDCLAVNQALADDSVGLIITSIPYLGAHHDYNGTFNDLATYDKYLDWLKERIADFPRILLPGAIVAINVDDPTSRSDERQERFRLPITRDVGLMLEEAGLSYFDELVWVKQNATGRKVAHGSVDADLRAAASRCRMRTGHGPNHSSLCPDCSQGIRAVDGRSRFARSIHPQ